MKNLLDWYELANGEKPKEDQLEEIVRKILGLLEKKDEEQQPTEDEPKEDENPEKKEEEA